MTKKSVADKKETEKHVDNSSISSMIHELPSKIDCHSRTGLVHAVVHRRTPAGLLPTSMTMSSTLTFSLVGNSGGNNNNDDSDNTESLQPPPLMEAKRQQRIGAGVHYVISDSRSGTYIGTLEQKRSDYSAHAYSLTLTSSSSAADSSNAKSVNKQHNKDKIVAWIVYRVPKVTTLISGSTRHAEVALATNPTSTTHPGLPTALFADNSNNNDGSFFFKSKSNLIGGNSSFVVLKSVEPYRKKNGNYGLNFHGRGRVASPRNMQLSDGTHSSDKQMDDEDDCDGNNSNNVSPTVLFQVAKWDKKVYNVDFAAPLTPFYAFGLALAQLDL